MPALRICHRIAHKTLLKRQRPLSTIGIVARTIDDLPWRSGGEKGEPLCGAFGNESEEQCRRAHNIDLHLYLNAYQLLSICEQRALQLVEVEEASYHDTAAILRITLENLKRVLFHARRKIQRSMRRALEELPHDRRPTRSHLR